MIDISGTLNSTNIEEFLSVIKKKFNFPSSPKFSSDNIRSWLQNLDNHKFKKFLNVDYINNKQSGFRDQSDILLNPDIICFGCSITYGIGVPEEYRWSNFLKTDMNLTMNNYGIPGICTSEIVLMILTLTKFVRPKYIICLIPEYSRQLLSYIENEGSIHYFNTFNNYEESFKENKEKYEVSKLYYQLPISNQIDRFVNDIHILCRFAELSSTKLLIGSWSIVTMKLMEEIKIENFKNSYMFDYLPPDNKGKDQFHPGIMYHYNLSQIIKNKIIEIESKNA